MPATLIHNDFMTILGKEVRPRPSHKLYFPEDVIRNTFSLQEQEVRKEKWIVFSKVLDFINDFEPKYNPLVDKKYWGDKMNMLMNNFPRIMQTLNE